MKRKRRAQVFALALVLLLPLLVNWGCGAGPESEGNIEQRHAEHDVEGVIRLGESAQAFSAYLGAVMVHCGRAKKVPAQ